MFINSAEKRNGVSEYLSKKRKATAAVLAMLALTACGDSQHNQTANSNTESVPTETSTMSHTSPTETSTETIIDAPPSTNEVAPVRKLLPAKSYNGGIRALSEYEHAIGHPVFDSSMQFFTPDSAELQDWHLDAIQQVNEAGVKPLIILEPDGWDYEQIAAGGYDAKILKYFTGLKEAGVTAEQLGTITVCPEWNVGGWDNATIDNYPACVAKFKSIAEQVFPGIDITTLVDTSSQEMGAMLDSPKTLNELKKLNLKTIGIQAFSNAQVVPVENGQADLSGYFNTSDIVALANALGTKDIWINTGISVKDKSEGQNISHSEADQIAIARQLIRNVHTLQELGLNIMNLNMFMENKIDSEKINFQTSPAVVKLIATNLQRLNVPLGGEGDKKQ